VSNDQRLYVEVRGPGEWIVRSSPAERSLHVYRVAPADWLVSEVGRPSEGRGVDLEHALLALKGDTGPRDWWRSVSDALGVAEDP
jgi:hypothetical protein